MVSAKTVLEAVLPSEERAKCMDDEVINVGGGLSGLTAAALLVKRGLSVAVIDKSQHPGGSCGVFKRGEVIFDQGAAMLYGFGEAGFNAHRSVFNCLEEPCAHFFKRPCAAGSVRNPPALLPGIFPVSFGAPPWGT